MNKDNAKDYLPLVQALAEGKTIEVTGWGGEWMDCSELVTNAPASRYRIKPSPSYRPWTFDEVPVGVVVATERGGGRYVITAAEERDNEGYVSVSLGQRDEVDTEELLANYTLLNGQPCGGGEMNIIKNAEPTITAESQAGIPFPASLRDWFAGKALEGLTAQPDCRFFDGRSDDDEGLAAWRVKIAREDAEHCYRLADAMLAERSK